MKSLWICLITILNLLSYGLAQKIQNFNENSNSPILQKEARVIGLKKIFTLDGNSDLYQLKDPILFKIAEDGSLFVLDWNRALYRFSSDGRFYNDLFKKGEGPGELKYLKNFFLKNKTVIQFCHYPNKIVVKNFKGELLKEYIIPANGVLTLMGIEDDKYFFSKTDFKLNEMKLSNKFKDFKTVNYYYSWKIGSNKTIKSSVSYTEYTRLRKIPRGITFVTSPLNAFSISNLKNSSQYFINSFDYKIMKINIQDISIQTKFGRPYKKTKYFHSSSYLEEMKKDKRPIKKSEKKYFQNVLKLFNQGDELWVITSTVKKGKGVLVDVFSPEGVYKDKFYLPIPGLINPHLPSFNIIDDKIIVLEKDEDENHIINLYQIKE